MISEPILMLKKDNIALGPLDHALLPVYTRWINDLEVTRTVTMGDLPTTLEKEELWFNSVALEQGSAIFTIYFHDHNDWVPVGNTGLHQISFKHGTAELGIMIGEKEYWDKGIGTSAVKLMLEYGFKNLELYNIMLRVYSFNNRAIHVYEKAGFKSFGIRHECLKIGNIIYDEIFMEAISNK